MIRGLGNSCLVGGELLESSREVLHGGQRYTPVDGLIPRIRAKRRGQFVTYSLSAIATTLARRVAIK